VIEGSVQSQIWNGSFTEIGACDIINCCCLGPKIELSDLGNGTLAMYAQLHGVCAYLTELSYGFDITTGYTISATSNGHTTIIQLSADSNMIYITDSISSQCAVNATRNVPLTTNQATSETIRFRGNFNIISIMLVMAMSIYMKK
jgi:hypothetical protein